jgi:hypothetical protein
LPFRVELYRDRQAKNIPENRVKMKNKVVNKAHSERHDDGEREHKLIKRRVLDKVYHGGSSVLEISEESYDTASGMQLY